MSLWTAAEAAQATGGRATSDWQATGVSIDTRTLQPGDLFIALKDVRDGHDFVAQALEKGAAAALVSRVPEGVAEDAPLLIVGDVLDGLTALGRAGRARSGARVVAITGSVGKTSTKEMVRAALAGQGRVHAAEASYNNHWGVPLTLARMPRETEFAVLEIGMNHPGEIAPLAQLAHPHVAMITTIAAAHLEAFDSLDGIADEKAAIFSGLTGDGTAIVNAALPQSERMIRAARAAGAWVVTFGAEAPADWRLGPVTVAPGATTAKAHGGGLDFLLKVSSEGGHFALNALGALAAATALGADLSRALLGLADWRPPAGRGTREEVILDPARESERLDLIDDSFNANPTSLSASLSVLAAAQPRDGAGRVEKGRRVAILGDMLELGPEEVAMHVAMAEDPSMPALGLIHCVGPRMKALYEALPYERRGKWVETAEELIPHVARLVDAGDVVLVKGSKGSRVSKVVDAIRNLGHRSASRDQEA
ncbi:UDP-N-acetylmuramoyl-tripeptide--D-alanyl-D-alanine ligase [Pseudoroseicyclus tamaricis]|uniref:UDP-N-acetylmuramoyl-tripeptide--D-alanyl-D-alanine ligase n=1 Tax=Pseudoroseicyclus tamaricis TaxID=2705421 RepID=A0A6B2JYC0_9RHOB|nr:UDP-N-acetylmuramoyl-tripeptide--D-alanyl-D-alanine ligase [Pseudoroseicyclus tamaricis]NDV00362.1 UDP-N-acetylmuramoyl-tripeptide--D-alanyl-D-alanine ligase [Pseudoroseicyclus tamaricis]